MNLRELASDANVAPLASRDAERSFLIVVEENVEKTYPLFRCRVFFRVFCARSCTHVNVVSWPGEKKRASEMPDLPLPVSCFVTEPRHCNGCPTTPPPKKKKKSLPSRFLFMFHNHLSGRRAEINPWSGLFIIIFTIHTHIFNISQFSHSIVLS